MHSRADTNFTYLLPVGPGTETQVYEMTSSPGKLQTGDSDQHSWYVLRLKMRPGDTIYAARKGVVTEVADQDGNNDAGGASAGKENYIEILHADCSFAHYGILRKNSALVKPGQGVKPGQAIGLVGGDQYGRGSEIRFSVYYNQEEDLQNGENIHQHYMEYIHLQCWTKNNGSGTLKHGAVYTGEFPLSLLNRELEKRSKKGKIRSKK
jgi:murein DD-endopeptidase MepM/ murein hydrolase activator NlpD